MVAHPRSPQLSDSDARTTDEAGSERHRKLLQQEEKKKSQHWDSGTADEEDFPIAKNTDFSDISNSNRVAENISVS